MKAEHIQEALFEPFKMPEGGKVHHKKKGGCAYGAGTTGAARSRHKKAAMPASKHKSRSKSRSKSHSKKKSKSKSRSHSKK